MLFKVGLIIPDEADKSEFLEEPGINIPSSLASHISST